MSGPPTDRRSESDRRTADRARSDRRPRRQDDPARTHEWDERAADQRERTGTGYGRDPATGRTPPPADPSSRRPAENQARGNRRRENQGRGRNQGRENWSAGRDAADAAGRAGHPPERGRPTERPGHAPAERWRADRHSRDARQGREPRTRSARGARRAHDGRDGHDGRDRGTRRPEEAERTRTRTRTTRGPEFESDTGMRIYEHVARHGPVSADVVRGHLGLGVEEFTYHLESLAQNGYVEERGDELRVTRPAERDAESALRGTEVTVRPARQADLAGVVGVMREVTAERTHVVAESVAEQVAYEETVLDHTSARSRNFFVATVDGDIVGWAHLTVPEIEKLSHTAELTVGVLEEHRGKGIGSALMERALGWADADGRLRVYQSVPATNRSAVGFLEANGWRVEAVRRNHYRIDGSFVDEVMMAVEL